MDYLRHANNVAYLAWIETARSEYFAQVLEERIDGPRGMIMAKIIFEYEAPIGYRAEIAIGTRISRFGSKSFDFQHEVWDESTGRRAGTSTTTLVAFDYAGNHSIEVPPGWRARAAALEARPESLVIPG